MTKQPIENQNKLSDLAQIIPIKHTADGKICYYMCKNVANLNSGLEFPSGLIDRGEDPSKAAEKWLEHYTGYKSKNIKFIYRHSPDLDKGPIFTYIAVVDEFGNVPKTAPIELTAVDLHKCVLDNEIIDSVSLAALTILLFRSPKMTNYLGSDIKEQE